MHGCNGVGKDRVGVLGRGTVPTATIGATPLLQHRYGVEATRTSDRLAEGTVGRLWYTVLPPPVPLTPVIPSRPLPLLHAIEIAGGRGELRGGMKEESEERGYRV